MVCSPIDEVERQHGFIEAWMAGQPVSDTGWQEFEQSLVDSFTIVGPEGREAGRADLLQGFSRARGAMPDVAIEIRNAAVLHQTDQLAVVRYEEWQIHPTDGNQRVSTVVLVADTVAPLGWSWLALHETGFS